MDVRIFPSATPIVHRSLHERFDAPCSDAYYEDDIVMDSGTQYFYFIVYNAYSQPIAIGLQNGGCKPINRYFDELYEEARNRGDRLDVVATGRTYSWPAWSLIIQTITGIDKGVMTEAHFAGYLAAKRYGEKAVRALDEKEGHVHYGTVEYLDRHAIVSGESATYRCSSDTIHRFTGEYLNGSPIWQGDYLFDYEENKAYQVKGDLQRWMVNNRWKLDTFLAKHKCLLPFENNCSKNAYTSYRFRRRDVYFIYELLPLFYRYITVFEKISERAVADDVDYLPEGTHAFGNMQEIKKYGLLDGNPIAPESWTIDEDEISLERSKVVEQLLSHGYYAQEEITESKSKPAQIVGVAPQRAVVPTEPSQDEMSAICAQYRPGDNLYPYVVQLYQMGISIRHIIKLLCTSHSGVCRILITEGLYQDKYGFWKLFADGKTLSEIVKETGHPIERVAYYQPLKEKIFTSTSEHVSKKEMAVKGVKYIEDPFETLDQDGVTAYFAAVYSELKSIVRTSKFIGTSKGSVSRILLTAGIIDDPHDVQSYINQGLTVHQTSQKLGLSLSYVHAHTRIDDWGSFIQNIKSYASFRTAAEMEDVTLDLDDVDEFRRGVLGVYHKTGSIHRTGKILQLSDRTVHRILTTEGLTEDPLGIADMIEAGVPLKDIAEKVNMNESSVRSYQKISNWDAFLEGLRRRRKNG